MVIINPVSRGKAFGIPVLFDRPRIQQNDYGPESPELDSLTGKAPNVTCNRFIYANHCEEIPISRDSIALSALLPRMKHPASWIKIIHSAESVLQPDKDLSSPTTRENISLPGIELETVNKAKDLASKINKKLLNESNGKLQKRLTYKKFCDLLKKINPLYNPTEEILTALYCIKTTENPNGFLSGMPIGILNQYEVGLEAFEEKVRMLSRHVLVDLKGIKTAKDVEELRGWSKIFQEPGLSVIIRELSLLEMLQITFPRIFHEFDPPVRMWLLPIDKNNVPGSRELKAFQSAWTLAIGTKVFDLNTNKFDIEAVKEKNWWAEFNNRVEFDYEKDSDVHSLTDLFKLGANALGIEDPIGIEEGKIPPWYITRKGMWEEVSANGRMLIDDVTEYLLTRHLPVKYPQCFDAEKNFKLECFDNVKWTDEYGSIASACLIDSKLKSHEALKRIRPEFFGIDAGKKTVGSISFRNKWNSSEGKSRLKTELARKLQESGLKCEFISDSGNSFVRFTGKDFRNWCNDYFIAAHRTWGDFFGENKLESALRHGTQMGDSGNSIGNAVAIFFGKTETVNLKGFTVETLFKQLGISDNDVVCIPLDSNSSTKITALQKATTEIPTIPIGELIDLQRKAKDPYPWDLARLRRQFYDKYVPNTVKNDSTSKVRKLDLAIDRYRIKEELEPFEYEEQGDLNYVRLAYDTLLFCLKNKTSIQEVFPKFIKAGKLSFEEAFNFANALCALEIDYATADNNTDDVDNVEALVLIIKAFDIPYTNEGKKKLLKLINKKSHIRKYSELAFRQLSA